MERMNPSLEHLLDKYRVWDNSIGFGYVMADKYGPQLLDSIDREIEDLQKHECLNVLSKFENGHVRHFALTSYGRTYFDVIKRQEEVAARQAEEQCAIENERINREHEFEEHMQKKMRRSNFVAVIISALISAVLSGSITLLIQH